MPSVNFVFIEIIDVFRIHIELCGFRSITRFEQRDAARVSLTLTGHHESVRAFRIRHDSLFVMIGMLEESDTAVPGASDGGSNAIRDTVSRCVTSADAHPNDSAYPAQELSAIYWMKVFGGSLSILICSSTISIHWLP